MRVSAQITSAFFKYYFLGKKFFVFDFVCYMAIDTSKNFQILICLKYSQQRHHLRWVIWKHFQLQRFPKSWSYIAIVFAILLTFLTTISIVLRLGFKFESVKEAILQLMSNKNIFLNLAKCHILINLQWRHMSLGLMTVESTRRPRWIFKPLRYLDSKNHF